MREKYLHQRKQSGDFYFILQQRCFTSSVHNRMKKKKLEVLRQLIILVSMIALYSYFVEVSLLLIWNQPFINDSWAVVSWNCCISGDEQLEKMNHTDWYPCASLHITQTHLSVDYTLVLCDLKISQGKCGLPPTTWANHGGGLRHWASPAGWQLHPPFTPAQRVSSSGLTLRVSKSQGDFWAERRPGKRGGLSGSPRLSFLKPASAAPVQADLSVSLAKPSSCAKEIKIISAFSSGIHSY